jgi:hypothetical protein
MIQDPANIKTNGHLFYTKQGMGKGMLAEFITRMLGSEHVISFENTERYFEKFNADHAHKILKIFEEVSDKGAAFKHHNRLKADQSKTRERVEPKGLDAFSTRNCARFWYFTNNENALFVEGDDRRYTCHRANNRFANNTDYFGPIWAETRDQQFCKVAFEFFATRETKKHNVWNCFENNFKLEQKEQNLPSGLRFLRDWMSEDGYRGYPDGQVPVAEMSRCYKQWCEQLGVKYNFGSFKTQIKKLDIKEDRPWICGIRTRCYTGIFHDAVLDRFRDHLKNPTFTFTE